MYICVRACMRVYVFLQTKEWSGWVMLNICENHQTVLFIWKYWIKCGGDHRINNKSFSKYSISCHSNNHTPSPILNISHLFSRFILATTLWSLGSRYHYHPHFTNEKNKAQNFPKLIPLACTLISDLLTNDDNYIKKKPHILI